MKAAFEAVIDAAMQLDEEDRCRVAASLWESMGDPVAGPDPSELADILNQSEADFDSLGGCVSAATGY